jgi:hypothetical protein
VPQQGAGNVIAAIEPVLLARMLERVPGRLIGAQHQPLLDTIVGSAALSAQSAAHHQASANRGHRHACCRSSISRSGPTRCVPSRARRLPSQIEADHAVKNKRLNRLPTLRAGDASLVAVQDPLTLRPRSKQEPDLMLPRPRDDYHEGANPKPTSLRRRAARYCRTAGQPASRELTGTKDTDNVLEKRSH